MGYSFLYKACENGQNNIVQLLLSHGADTNVCNIYGYSPLFIAFENKHDNIVQRLLSHEANINSSDRLGESPLNKACQHDHYSAVQLLLSQEADINLCDILGKSPFHYACQNEQNHTVHILLSHGADINLCDKLGESPQHDSCQVLNIMLMLVSMSIIALCNFYCVMEQTLICNIFGHCPLYTACQNGHDSIVQILLGHRADVNLCDDYRESPLIQRVKIDMTALSKFYCVMKHVLIYVINTGIVLSL